MTSIIYKSPLIYKTVMRILHKKSYPNRYKIIAKEVGKAKVLDLCCGDCELSKYVKNYKGADLSPHFVKSAKKRGLDVIELDVLKDDIPKSECIVMQASLYQFIPNHKKVVEKMLKKGKKVIISDSIINWAQSDNKFIAWIARVLTRTSKEHADRFTEESLTKLFKEFKAKKIIKADREIIGVFE